MQNNRVHTCREVHKVQRSTKTTTVYNEKRRIQHVFLCAICTQLFSSAVFNTLTYCYDLIVDFDTPVQCCSAPFGNPTHENSGQIFCTQE